MNIITINGYIGGSLSSIIFIPQLYKIYITKSSNDISWSFLFLAIISSIFSLIYYIEINADPMTFTNIFSLFTRILLVFFKIYYDFFFKKNTCKERLLNSEI